MEGLPMSRFSTRAAVAVALMTTACTQNPAVIDLRGQNTYGPQGVSYASNASRYSSYSPSARSNVPMATLQAAPNNTPISISDLGPPAPQPVAVAEAPPPAPMKEAPVAKITAPAPVIASKEEAKKSVNPWTGKSRETASAKAPTKPKPVRLSSDNDTQALIWPVNGNKVLSGFGPKGGGKANDGINIAAADGEPVWAAADGEVIYADSDLAGYGNMVIIKHSGNKTTTYAHLSRSTVDKYERVQQGDIIGYVGTTGNVKKPQLHFALRDGSSFIDPQRYISRSLASN
jgi:murein DD-endopeptidase MepM/ murein hydrolase activator NlpD